MNNWLKNNHLLNFNQIKNKLLKQNCVLCVATSHNNLSICRDCLQSLSVAPTPCCKQCGLNTQGEVCGTCLKHPPHFDATQALLIYTFPTDALLQHYKYNNALYLSEVFGHLLSNHLLNTDSDIVIPMPLHKSRLQKRGFNQSLEIAKVVSKRLNITLDSACCSRIKNTPPQASLPLKERLKNMHGAFEINPELATGKIKGKRVSIIDDVMTTGASLNELAKMLKNAGAEHVECWVIARALAK